LSKLRFDLAEEGLHCILKPWQAEIMRFLWDTGEPQDSRAVHEYVQGFGEEIARSRAAVIFFLNYMVDEGFLDYYEETTKGGRKRVYRLNERSVTESSFRGHVAERFYGRVREFQIVGQEEAEG